MDWNKKVETLHKKLYTVWKIPKRKGGFRQIESPCDELKKRQKDMLRELSGVFKVSPFAYAFTYYKNIAVHALPHVGKKWVASIDLSDFFPSITMEKFFKVVLKSLKWGDEKRLQYRVAVSLGREERVKIIDVKLFYQTCFHDFKDGKETRLPQGAPTSPFLSNAYLFKFDWLMARMCHKRACDYTRYADDLVISGEDKEQIAVLLKIAESVLNSRYALQVNHKKTKIIHKTRRQLVCGVVVNEKLNTQRKLRKNLRAEIFQIKQKGGELPEETKGRIAFHQMVRENKKTTDSSREIITQILVAQKLNQ